MPEEAQTEIRLMAISHTEFLRSLTPLEKHYRCHIDEEQKQVVISDGPRSVEVHLGPETSQRLGALQMPAMEIELSFHGFTPEELKRFRSRFDLCFRRGGG